MGGRGRHTRASDAFSAHDDVAGGFRPVRKVHNDAVFPFLYGYGPLAVLDGHARRQPLPQAGPVGPDELARPVVAAAHLDRVVGPVQGDLGHEGQREQVVHLLERRHVGGHGRVEVVQHPGAASASSASVPLPRGKRGHRVGGGAGALRVQSNCPPLESLVGVMVALEDFVRYVLSSQGLGQGESAQACTEDEDMRLRGRKGSHGVVLFGKTTTGVLLSRGA